MSNERAFTFDIGAEIDRYFDDSSVTDSKAPRIVVLTGGTGSGKTTIRKERFSSGYVLIDAAEIFLSLSRGEFFPFPDAFEQPMDVIGGLVARRAIAERRNVVTELIGADIEPLKELIEAMRGIDYVVSMQFIDCDVQEAWRRNLARGDDNISCYYAEPYQRRWLLEAAAASRSPNPEGAIQDLIGMNESSSVGQSSRAFELAGRLNRQRGKWLEAVVAEWRGAEATMGEGMTSVPDRSAASAIASAFQAVHVLSLASGNKYVPTEQMEPSTKVLCEHLCDASITDKWKNAIRHYTDLKAKALGEQLLNFSEEMAITLSGSPAGGMLLGPGLLPLANECLLRNLGIAADFFGDDATARAMAQAVHKLHDDA